MPELGELFGLSVSPWELIIRGSAMYWFLVLIFGSVCGQAAPSASRTFCFSSSSRTRRRTAMAGEYKSITDGMIRVSTIIGWNVLIDWLSYVSPRPHKK